MKRERTASVWITASLLVAMLAAPGAYLGGYFALTKYTKSSRKRAVRTFPNDFSVAVYGPVVALESRLRGQDILGINERDMRFTKCGEH
jgi:hypothetical protein